MYTTFEERRENEPQAVIDDLLAQIARQAKAIYEKNKALGLDIEDGAEPAAKEAPAPKSKPSSKRRKSKSDETPLIPDE